MAGGCRVQGQVPAGGHRKWEEDGIWREMEEAAFVVTGTRTGDQGPPTQPGSRNKTEHQKYKVAKTVLSSIYYHNDFYECHLLPPHLELIPAPNRVTVQLHLPTPPLARVSSLHLVCCVTEGPRPGWRERVSSCD